MKHIPILLFALLLLACDQRSKPNKGNAYWEKEKPYSITRGRKIGIDTVTTILSEDTIDYQLKNMPHPESTSSIYDNMRGFDPASENDMDDNGISRYIENNDDEGWN